MVCSLPVVLLALGFAVISLHGTSAPPNIHVIYYEDGTYAHVIMGDGGFEEWKGFDEDGRLRMHQYFDWRSRIHSVKYNEDGQEISHSIAQ